MKPGITERQKLVLDTVKAAIGATGHAPTYGELSAATGLSQRRVETHFRRLAAKGHLSREGRILRVAGGVEHPPMRIQVVSRLHRNVSSMYGDSLIDTVSVDRSMFRFDTDGAVVVFGLKMQGSAMVGAGIFDGDYVLVRLASPKVGDLVAALVGNVTVVRRYSVLPAAVRLDSANDSVRPIFVAHEDVERVLHAVGVVVGLFRRVPEPKPADVGNATEFEATDESGVPSGGCGTV